MSIRPDAIEQVRRRLEAGRSELLARQSRVGRDLAHQNEPLVADASDRAIQTQNDEPLEGIEAVTEQEIVAIDEALERLALGLYGACKQCGRKIQSSRLAAMPQAVMCTSCRVDSSLG